MNDRFTFRVWYKQGKKFFDGIYPGYMALPNTSNEEAFVLEQCTGLKDKKGRLIYENDYVKIGDEIFRVFWNSTKISLENMLKNDIIDMQKNYIMEIVGNAHEERDIREVQKNS